VISTCLELFIVAYSRSFNFLIYVLKGEYIFMQAQFKLPIANNRSKKSTLNTIRN